METTNSTSFNLNEENDYDLLELMSWQDSEPETAKLAWGEFYKRHGEYIYNVVLKEVNGVLDMDTVADITAETFLRVFEKGARTFNKSNEADPDRIRGHVRSWLGKIANNLIFDFYRGRSFEEINLSFDEINNITSIEVEPLSEASIKLGDIMERVLNDKEKHVLRISSMYHDPTNPNKKLPDAILEEVCCHWGITRVNFRQIKHRAIKKLKNEFDLIQTESTSNGNII